jgi:hypothetical protein
MDPSILVDGFNDDSPYGIQCVDKRTRAHSLDEVLPAVDALGEMTRLFGDLEPILIMACSQWKMGAKERYEGKFQDIKTKHPILFIDNTFDPATSIRSAHNASAGFDSSVVLQNDGSGVSILSLVRGQ